MAGPFDQFFEEEPVDYSRIKSIKADDIYSCLIESFDGTEFRDEFLKIYNDKYPGLKNSRLSAYSGMTYERNVGTSYPLEWYKFYFGLDVNEEAVSKDGTLSLKLPKRFNEIAIKFRKRSIFTECKKINLALIPEKEAAELVVRSGIKISERPEIYKIISVW